MGFFERLLKRSKREGRLAREAREREAAGDLAEAVTLYTDAGLLDDAARVLLLRADAEGSVEKRLAFCALAASRAQSEELKQKARARKALIAFDMLRGRGAAFLASEVLAAARELEDAGELERAAEAYALGGDGEGEVRALTAAGAIEKLEERLRAAAAATREQRDLETCLRAMADLDRTADLFASSGQLARAVGAIERVLAREIDAPGARERHQRWIAALGYARGPARRFDEATIVAPEASRSPFRLVREAARGGAGAVYEAEDDVLGRKVAFKVYHGRAKDRDAIVREARATAALAGPGVARVLDASPEEGWLALEWIARGSVRDMLKAGDLATLSPIGRWARPLARALARVHAAGIVHADVKPANVLLRQPNDPALTDFGIARPIGAPADGGSAGYLSPERLGGRPSDPRDDVYGYGRVLEDVLHRLEGAGVSAGPDADAFRALAMACVGPDEARPASGADLVRRLP